MTIKIKATVHIKGQQDLRAIVDDLQELERFDQSTFSFKLHPEGAPAPLFLQNVRARPIHDIVREVLARSDAVRSSWYKSPPRGQPFPKRVRAGTASIREQQRELALALLQEGAPHALTSRNALRTNYAAEINNASAGQLAQNF